MFEFRLPDLGEGIHEGEILKWYVKEGDSVNEEDPLCDIETDKAAVTIPSPRKGVIVSLTGKPGDIINVDDILVVIDDGKEVSETDLSEKKEDAGKKMGDENKKEKKLPEDFKKSSKKAVAAPATRRLAREMEIDINTVEGSGPGGRVTVEDLERYKTDPVKKASDTKDGKESGDKDPENEKKFPAKAYSETNIPFFEPGELSEEKGEYEEVPIVSLRRKTAVKTTVSKIIMPHVAHMDEIDVTGLEGVRKEYNEKYGDSGKLTLLAFVIKALSSLLKKYPEFNSSIDNSKMTLRLKKYYNIGFAADTKKGLMVPVIKDADRKNLSGVGKSIRDLTLKAREGSIKIDDLSGGTFTVTNVGTLGGTFLFPVINYPESAILGMGSVKEKPVVRDGKIVIRTILPVSFCFDHRVADGANAARLVGDLKEMLEDSIKYTAWI